MKKLREILGVSKEKIAQYLNIGLEMYDAIESDDCSIPDVVKNNAKSVSELKVAMRKRLVDRFLAVFDNLSFDEQVELIEFVSKKGSEDL